MYEYIHVQYVFEPFSTLSAGVFTFTERTIQPTVFGAICEMTLWIHNGVLQPSYWIVIRIFRLVV